MNFVNTCYGLCSIIVLTTVAGIRINGRTPEECSATEWYYCFLSPCYFKSCQRYPSADCSVQTTGCGGCRAVWSINGQEVNCDLPSRCPLGMREMMCPNSLCARPFCPDYPEAVCWKDTCGQCGEIYLLDGLKVDCFSSVRHRIRRLPTPKTTSRFPSPVSSHTEPHKNNRVRVVAGNPSPSIDQPFQPTLVENRRPPASLVDEIIGVQHPNGQVTFDIPADTGASSINLAHSGDVQISSGFSAGVNNDPRISSHATIPRLNIPRSSTPIDTPTEPIPSIQMPSSNKLPSISSNPQVPNTLNVQPRTSTNVNAAQVPQTNFPSQTASNVNSPQVPVTSNVPKTSNVNSVDINTNVDKQNTEPSSPISTNSDPFAFADTNNGLLSQNNPMDTLAMIDLGLGDTALLDSPIHGMDPTGNVTQAASDVNNNPSPSNGLASTDPFSHIDFSFIENSNVDSIGTQNSPIDNTQQSNVDPLSNQPVQDQIGGVGTLSSPTSQSSSSRNNPTSSTVVENPIQGTPTSTDVISDPFLSSNIDATDPSSVLDFVNIDLPPVSSPTSDVVSAQTNPLSVDSIVPGVEVTSISPPSPNNRPQPNNAKVDPNQSQTNSAKSIDPTSLAGVDSVPATPQNSPLNPTSNPIVTPQRRQPSPGNPALNGPETQNAPGASELGTPPASTPQRQDPLIPPQSNEPRSPPPGDSQIPIDMVAPRIPGAVGVIQSNAPLTGIVKPCLPGTTEVTCVENPCTNQTCHLPGAVCHQSGCGSCHAEWHVDGRKVDCSPPCPRDTIEAVCRDPCTFLGCPAYPNAICRMSKCSACTANYYVNNEKVNCDLVTETCPPGEEPRGCTCPIKICPYNLQVRCRVIGCGSNCSFEFYKMSPEGVGEPVECGWFSRRRG